MSLKFIGEVSRKLGSVDRGLLEVSCQIEIEFDETYSDDADDIQRRVEKAYATLPASGRRRAEQAGIGGIPFLKTENCFERLQITSKIRRS
jgi:hypothetical protein